MSGSIVSPNTAAQNAANAVASGNAASASTTSAAGSTSSASNPLGTLTDNYQTFLTMLTTQLQNQDPTSPMDSSQFTSELVQFSGVEQQIQTNSSLTQLIQLTQGAAVMQSSQILGKQVQVTAPDLTVQNGTAAIDFTVPSAGPVAIAIYDSAGNQLLDTTVTATQGANQWTWNGQAASGLQMPDGSYRVGVASASNGATATTLPFTVVGTATGVQQQGSNVMLNLGALQVNMTAVVSVGS